MTHDDNECWADYEAAIGPPPGAAAKIRARVDRVVARRDRVEPREAEVPRAAAAILVMKSSAMSVAIAIAALGGLHVAARAIAPAPAELPAAVVVAPEQPRTPEGDTANVAAASIPEVTPTVAAPPPMVAGAPVARPRVGASVPAPKAVVDTLAEETEIITRGRAASERGEHAEALQLFAEHARRFPRGVMVPEREAFAAIARCKSGARGSILATFTAAYPRSPYLERVRDACDDSSTDRSTPPE